MCTLAALADATDKLAHMENKYSEYMQAQALMERGEPHVCPQVADTESGNSKAGAFADNTIHAEQVIRG